MWLIFHHNMTIKVKGAIVKQQFAVVRNAKKLNAFNLLAELEKLNNFEDEMKMENPDEIAENVKKKLNIVIDKLAPFKRIQVKKKTNISAKTKELFEKAKVAKNIQLKPKMLEMQD